MRRNLFKNIIGVLFILLNGSLLKAQATQGFERFPAPVFNSSTDASGQKCWFIDTDNMNAHTLLNQTLNCGNITVQETGTSSIIGYSIEWLPSANDNAGFSDGDNFGVINSTSFTTEFGTGSPVEGNQAFSIEDTDGDIRMTFDKVDLNGTTNPLFSMQYFLNSTGYETLDFLRISLAITDCPGATTLSLLDIDGDDIDDGMPAIPEEQWNVLSQDLTSYTTCLCQLIIEASNNSATEQYAIDDISFTQGVVQLTPLPVELSLFTVENVEGKSHLYWETHSEYNNHYFEVERSYDADIFVKIGTVYGAGTTFEPQTYQFVDLQARDNSKIYYRLKQVDIDGGYTYSNIIVLQSQEAVSIDLQVSPNPAIAFVDVAFSGLPDISFDCFVYSTQGVLIEKVFIPDISQNRFTLDVHDWSPGLYQMVLRGKQGQSLGNKKILKTN